ncbi:hypothetical protein [Nonomuraea montanisoli]|uniref:hypothetical protein n=1 Tax=Nonomuraea montanisoli TaxID=2741721 RepID=UPI0038B2CFE3
MADHGCGPGRVTAHLRDRGLDTFGLDLSRVKPADEYEYLDYHGVAWAGFPLRQDQLRRGHLGGPTPSIHLKIRTPCDGRFRLETALEAAEEPAEPSSPGSPGAVERLTAAAALPEDGAKSSNG